MNPEITTQHAEESLAAIETTMVRARHYAASVASPILYLWGAIWILAYGLCHFYPTQSGLIWAPLSTLGAVLSVVFSKRAPVRSSNDGRFGLAWLVLFGFAGVWFAVLIPWDHAASFDALAMQRALGAYAATLVMFAYVMMGLWWDRFFMWLGLVITGLTLLGYFGFPAYFNLWMAFLGGGLLFASGWLIKRRWLSPA